MAKEKKKNPDYVFKEIGDIPLTFKTNFEPTNVCYIVLTCEKYLNTRAKWQNNTCFNNVDPKDVYFLSHKSALPNIYGWETEDDYKSCITKYIKFFQNMTIDYDWYMFIDDDTYVFPNRVEQYLARFDKKIPIYCGSMWSHQKNLRFMSGGAGFFITKPVYLLLIEHLKIESNTVKRQPTAETNGDATFGIWIRNINRQNNYPIKLYNDWKYLNIGKATNLLDLLKAVTLHQVDNEELFLKYDKYKYVTNLSLGYPRKIEYFPSQTSAINISPKTDKNSFLRHSNYKVFSEPLEHTNPDKLFFFIKEPNNTYRIESKNYPGHFITIQEPNELLISNEKGQHSFWQIDQSAKEVFSFKSLSPMPQWKNKYLTVSKKTVSLGPMPTLFNILIEPPI